MHKLIFVAIIGMLLYSPAMAFTDFNPHGVWYFDGHGFAERGFSRSRLNTWGRLFVQTRQQDGSRYVTNYDVRVTLSAPGFNINMLTYQASTTLREPMRVPRFAPTPSAPFRLPDFTRDGLTYSVKFTSANAGTVRIRGTVGNVRVDSTNVMWREGTRRPKTYFADGCNVGGAGAMALPLVALALALAFKRKT